MGQLAIHISYPCSSESVTHDSQTPSEWVVRWSHLVRVGGSVLDVACGHGRHMKWFAARGHAVTGVDRSPDAIAVSLAYGEAICADIENNPWPLVSEKGTLRQFDAVVVTNYLWRANFPNMCSSLLPGGLLIYETFTAGNETVGKPSRPDFLLNSGELLLAFPQTRIVAFEDGFLSEPNRFVQRIAAIKLSTGTNRDSLPQRYPL